MAITTVQPGGPVAPDDALLATIYTWCNGQLGLTSMCYSILTAAPGFRLGDFAYSFQTAITTDLAAAVANPVRLLGTRVTKLAPVNQSKAGVSSDTAVGTGGATLMPTQTTGIISYYSIFRGRKGRARMFIPFPSTAFATTATGLPSAAYVAVLETLATTINNFVTATSEDTLRVATCTTSIFHRATLTADFIETDVARPYWGTQKRRGDLGKANPPYIPL